MKNKIYFNFLVTGQSKAWNFSTYELPDTSRYLEYTDPTIKTEFKTLDDETIGTLKNLPALFTYEGSDQPAKIGYITRIVERAKSIFIEYEFESRIPEFSFAKLDDQKYRIGIQNWEMNRSHWAIKDGNLFEILYAADIIDENLLHSLGNFENIRDRQFKVAFSFPGEKRSYISEIVTHLKRRLPPGSVFYDNDFTDDLAVPNLDTLLQKIYLDNSELIVIFLCEEYEKKPWCGIEWRAIREHIKNRRDNSVMFMRFDDAAVQGVFTIDGYIDLRNKNPVHTAELITRRVKKLEVEKD